MYLIWMSTASFITFNNRGVFTCFKCIIGNTKLIQHRFIKSFVFEFGRIAILKKNKGRLH